MQNHFGDDNVNLSVCAPEAGMLQPEALRQASSLTVDPLFLSTRNHVNSEGGGERKKCIKKCTQTRTLSGTWALTCVLKERCCFCASSKLLGLISLLSLYCWKGLKVRALVKR